jgi:hypothetical protein
VQGPDQGGICIRRCGSPRMDGCNARRDSAGTREGARMWLDRTIWVIWIWAEIWMLLCDLTF